MLSLLPWILFIVVSLLTFLLFPIWAFLECVRSSHLSTKEKALWATLIALAGPLAALFYAFLKGKRRPLRQAAKIALVALLALVTFTSVTMTRLFRDVRSDISDTIDQIGDIDFSELEEEAPINIVVSLGLLQEELRGVWCLRLVRKYRAIELYRIFARSIEDAKLSSAEYESWMERFETRVVFPES